MSKTKKSICVYASSSSKISQTYFNAACELGKILADKKYTLVYGGAHIGLMGQLAQTVYNHGGKIIGVIPQDLADRGLAFESANEIVITSTLRERKEKMEKLSDAFIALPGGFGTLEEVLEIITLKQLNIHSKPVVFINTDNFYEPLSDVFNHLFDNSFAKRSFRSLYSIVEKPLDAVEFVESYLPDKVTDKW